MSAPTTLTHAARRLQHALQQFIRESQGDQPYELFFYDEHLLNEPLEELAGLHPDGELPTPGRWLWHKFQLARSDTGCDFRVQQRAVFDAHAAFYQWLVQAYQLEGASPRQMAEGGESPKALNPISEQPAVPGLDKIEQLLTTVATRLNDTKPPVIVKEFYTVVEMAAIVKRKPYTVREWCRHGRIRAEKRRCGHGRNKDWQVSHDELVRYQNEGLLPTEDGLHRRRLRTRQ